MLSGIVKEVVVSSLTTNKSLSLAPMAVTAALIEENLKTYKDVYASRMAIASEFYNLSGKMTEEMYMYEATLIEQQAKIQEEHLKGQGVKNAKVYFRIS